MSDDSDNPPGAGRAYTVSARPDGWHDLPGRRPLSAAERARLRHPAPGRAARHISRGGAGP